jgi:hypothetical protein
LGNLSRFSGVSEAGARRRNPEQSEGSFNYQIINLPNYQIDQNVWYKNKVFMAQIKVEALSRRERSGVPSTRDFSRDGVSSGSLLPRS